MTLTEARAKEMELTTLLSDDMPEEEYDKIAVKRDTLSSQIAIENSILVQKFPNKIFD